MADETKNLGNRLEDKPQDTSLYEHESMHDFLSRVVETQETGIKRAYDDTLKEELKNEEEPDDAQPYFNLEEAQSIEDILASVQGQQAVKKKAENLAHELASKRIKDLLSIIRHEEKKAAHAHAYGIIKHRDRRDAHIAGRKNKDMDERRSQALKEKREHETLIRRYRLWFKENEINDPTI